MYVSCEPDCRSPKHSNLPWSKNILWCSFTRAELDALLSSGLIEFIGEQSGKMMTVDRSMEMPDVPE